MPAPAPINPHTAEIRQNRPADALRGPEVADRDTPVTLVRRSFGAGIDRLEIDPTEAALELIDIDDDARQRAIAILDRRAAAMDSVVLDNLDELTEIQSAAEAGRMFRVLQIASRLHRDFEREAGSAPLVDQITGVLPTDDAQELRSLVEEYWDALARAEGGGDVGRIEAFVIRRRAALEIFGKEIERAFERVTMDAGGDAESEAWERILGALDLAPEQERKIRALARDFYIDARFNPTQQEQADFLTGVYLRLDADQRTRFFRLIVSGPEDPAQPAESSRLPG